MKFFKGKHAPIEDKAAYKVGRRWAKDREKKDKKEKDKKDE